MYPHAFLTDGHARIEEEIPDKPNSGLALDQDPLASYLTGQLSVRMYTVDACPCGPARVHFNSSAKLSLFPPEASFTEYLIPLVHSLLIHPCNFFVVAPMNSDDFM